MTYQALYRQWRPQTFADFVGQDHVTQTLQNALQYGRLAHAYLFCGSRGTGKTSAAKILAKAINCEQGPSREPCNECPACLGIQAGRVMDVLEIDAASNRGIDEIRDLREKARYAPVEVRRKIYIIDEAHMLTTEAFNALLKTLEEPPGQVMFILATTEPHKLPATIISRCQRLDFRLIPMDILAERLRAVAESAGRQCEEEALLQIAEAAAGSLRDGLSLLEQVLAYAPDVITGKDVLSVLGAVGRDVFYSLAAARINGDLAAALLLLREVAAAGKDFHHFTVQAIAYYRDLMVVSACGRDAAALGISPEWHSRLSSQAQALGMAEIGRTLTLLHELQSEIRWSGRPRLSWELAVFDMFALSGLHLQQQNNAAALEYAAAKAENRPEPADRVSQPVSIYQTADVSIGEDAKIQRLWPKVLDEVKKVSVRAHAVLLAGEPVSFDAKVLEIHFDAQFHCDMMENEQNKQPLQQVLQRITGKQIAVRCIMRGKSNTTINDHNDPDELITSAMEIFRGQLIDDSGNM